MASATAMKINSLAILVLLFVLSVLRAALTRKVANGFNRITFDST